MEKENDDIERAMLFHVIDEFDVSGLLDIPDLTMDRTGDLRAAEENTEKTRKTTEPLKKSWTILKNSGSETWTSKMGAMKRKRTNFIADFGRKDVGGGQPVSIIFCNSILADQLHGEV